MVLTHNTFNDVHSRAASGLAGEPGHIVKWPGGKERELKHLLPLIPPFQTAYEPFVGGGAMYLALRERGGRRRINDKSKKLISIYRAVAQGEPSFFRFLETLDQQWASLSTFASMHHAELLCLARHSLDRPRTAEEKGDLVELFVARHGPTLRLLVESLGWGPGASYFLAGVKKSLLNKMERIGKMEAETGIFSERDALDTMECALKGALYGYVRYMYNYQADFPARDGEKTATFFFMRETAYSAMFRHNAQGMFNAPYAGATYNKKSLMRKIAFLRSETLRSYLSETEIDDQDFEVFLRSRPVGEEDFLFLDPPYPGKFSTYDQNEFDDRHHLRLAEYLRSACPAKFMLVVNNTPLMLSLYANCGFTIKSFETTYQANFQTRNNRNAEHLIITNY